MPIRPRLVSNVPFWILLAGSLVSLFVGIWITLDKLGLMVRTLTDQSATGVEVYAGQAFVFVGAALIGAGIIGLALAATVAAVSSLRPVGALPEPISWAAEEDVAIVTDAAPVVAETPVAPATPVVDAAPAAPTTPATDGENTAR